MLTALVEDSLKSQKQLSSAKTSILRLNKELTELNEQMKQLTVTLNIKRAAFKTAESTQHELSERLVLNEMRKTGLCIR